MSKILEVRASFKVGQVLTVTGVPEPNGHTFSINVGQSEDDIALHVDVRFDHRDMQRKVLLNSCHSGTWHNERIFAKSFPFNDGEKFKVSITFTKEKFFVTLPDKSVTEFPNRPGYEMYNLIFLKAKVKVHGIEIIDQSGC